MQPILDESELETRAIDWKQAEENYVSFGSAYPVDYMFDRGFSADAMLDFQICWDSLSGRFAIPVRDIEGRLIGFKARAIDDRKPKYLVLGDKEGERPRYGFALLPEPRRLRRSTSTAMSLSLIVVCEGELNAIATVQKTERPAVAINGSHFHPTHAKIIRQIAGEDGIDLFLDEDEAGLDCMWGRWDSQADGAKASSRCCLPSCQYESSEDTSRTQEISLEMRSSNFWKILSRGCWQSELESLRSLVRELV